MEAVDSMSRSRTCWHKYIRQSCAVVEVQVDWGYMLRRHARAAQGAIAVHPYGAAL